MDGERTQLLFAPRRGSSAGVVTGLWDTVTRTEPRVLCHRTLRPRGICSGKRVWFVLIWSALCKRERQEHQRRAGSSSRRGGRPLGHVTGTGPRVPCHDARAASSRHGRRRAWPTRRTLSGAACVVGGAGEWARKRAGNVWRANFQGDKSIETQPMTARAKFSRSFAVRGWGWASIDAGYHAEGRVLVLWGVLRPWSFEV